KGRTGLLWEVRSLPSPVQPAARRGNTSVVRCRSEADAIRQTRLCRHCQWHSSLTMIPLHLVTQFNHTAPVGFKLGEMESDVLVQLLEERDAITNQYRQD